MRRRDLIYKEECYRIVGFAFDVFNRVGFGHKELFYQKALAEKLKKEKIKFKEQLKVNVEYNRKILGHYFLDFLIFDKIVVEIKVRNYFSKQDIEQVYKYLKVTNLKLGLIIHFARDGVKYKRIVNLK